MDAITEEKIKRYHTEEIILILFILSSNPAAYCDEDLVELTECIEGRIELLFTPDYLETIHKHLTIPPNVVADFVSLKDQTIKLYASSWHKKLATDSEEMAAIKATAVRILKNLNITYVEPFKYADDHLEIDWI